MNKAEALAHQVDELVKNYKESEWIKKARESRNPYNDNNKFFNGETVYNDHIPFYHWLATLIKLKQPKIAVEFGALYGGSAAFILSELSPDGKLYSIDKREERDTWCFVPRWEERIIRLDGLDDTSFHEYPEYFPWDKVDFYLIDSEHNADHVRQLMDKIFQHRKENLIIINHDVYTGGIANYIKFYPYDYYELGKHVAWCGVGLHVL